MISDTKKDSGENPREGTGAIRVGKKKSTPRQPGEGQTKSVEIITSKKRKKP